MMGCVCSWDVYYIRRKAVIYTGQIYLGAFTPAVGNVVKCQNGTGNNGLSKQLKHRIMMQKLLGEWPLQRQTAPNRITVRDV